MTRRPSPPLDLLLESGDPTDGSVRLTPDERLAIHNAAQAEGFSSEFAELLCRFAELIGAEQVVLELKEMKIPEDT